MKNITKVLYGETPTYTYESGTNRLQEVTGPVSYTHDDNGNITGIGDKVLTHSQNNSLVRVEEKGYWGYCGI